MGNRLWDETRDYGLKKLSIRNEFLEFVSGDTKCVLEKRFY